MVNTDIDSLSDAATLPNMMGFNYKNQCCNAPCPPGALCNNKSCGMKTKFWRQHWTCFWQKTPTKCVNPPAAGQPADGMMDENGYPQAAYQKLWRCNFQRVERCDVLRAFSCRPGPRCPCPDAMDNGESECWVPHDQYFAEIFEVGYEKCLKKDDFLGECEDCEAVDEHHRIPACSGACCGVQEVVESHIQKIDCKEQIPPDFPFAPPLPYYQRPTARARVCADLTCGVRANGAKSPNFWLDQARVFA